MDKFIQCKCCRRKNSLNTEQQSKLSNNPNCRITCIYCNKTVLYTRNDSFSLSGTIRSGYTIYNNKFIHYRKIAIATTVAMVVAIIIVGLELLPRPIDILVSVFISFAIFLLGPGAVKIQYNNPDALKSIKISSWLWTIEDKGEDRDASHN